MKAHLSLTLAIVAVFALLLTQSVVHVSATTSPASGVSWWDTSWHYRILYTVYSGDYNRIDVPVEIEVNFTRLLTQFGASGSFDENSLRVIEYKSPSGVLLEIPSQFDKAQDYNASSNAVGTVAWIMNGTTPTRTARIYYVYFDTLENGPKSPPSYMGVSSKTSGDYVVIQNERLNVTVRYRNGVYLDRLDFDKNEDKIFEYQLIDSSTPYTLLVRVSDADLTKHNWTDAFFVYTNDENATLTTVRDGPIVQEIKLSNVSLKNEDKEALNIDVELTFKVYKLNAQVYTKTSLTVNEELEVNYAYERTFLDNKDLYDRWYIDEDYNGMFSYRVDYRWFFSGVPTYGFMSSYNSSGSAGLAFIPNIEDYSGINFGEYAVLGPALRLSVKAGNWSAGEKIELKNRLFAHFGDWSRAREETLSIKNPPTFVTSLSVHLIDSNGLDLGSAEVRIHDSKGAVVRTGYSDPEGWAIFPIEVGEYTIVTLLMGLPVANETISITEEAVIDPLKCTVYSLSVYTIAANDEATEDVTVGIYQYNGVRVSSSKTNSTGQAFFKQLPVGDFVVKTYYLEEQFGISKSIQLENNAQLTIKETIGLGAPKQVRYDIIYGTIVGGFAVAAVVAILKVKHAKFVLGLLLCILILATILALAYIQSSPSLSHSSVSGISRSYNHNTGFVTVGDVAKVRWKDHDTNGELDDSELFVTSSNGIELLKIDLGTNLVTPTSVHRLSEAEIKKITFLDKTTNNYTLYRPLIQEPNFKNQEYQRSLNLRFVFSKPDRWEVALNISLEMGKSYVQMQWEITEKGEGEGNYSIYPQIIPLQPLDRLILPANYTDKRLRFWNQINGPTYANPWRYETDWSIFGAFVANIHVNNPNVYLHSGEDYAIQTSVHASSAFARHSSWIHDKTASYFQYDFWLDWDGETPPSSDIQIEVWVPDVIDLANSQISYTLDGSTWVKYDGWTLTEGDRGENGFSTYRGCERRLKINFPAIDFTADNGVDTGSDYGDPKSFFRNDEYLVRLKVAYQNEGLTTYEFENSQNSWYGIRNINDAWLWLVGTNQDLSIGTVLTKPLEHLAVQANNMEVYRNITMGFDLPLASNGKVMFYTNFVVFTQAARQDQDSDGIWNMFDENMPKYFSSSALLVSMETFSELSYYEGFDEEVNFLYMSLGKKPVGNYWDVTPKYTVCLSNGISQHLESDNAIFLFERYGYYVYDVGQTNEVRWREKAVDPLPMYQLYASLGLIGTGSVLLFKHVNVVKKYRIIFVLFIICLAVRLVFQSLSIDFSGTDAGIYGNVAQNFLDYGQFQVNYIGLEAHFVRAGAIPNEITHSYIDPSRLIYPSLIVSSFIMFGQSFFAIKSVDVILGALLVIPTFYLAKKLFNEKTAIVAATIVVFHPLLIYYSGTHPSTGVMATFLATAALCAMVYEGKKAAIVAGFFAGVSLFARMEFGFILLGAVMSYYILNFKRGFWRKKDLYIIVLVFLAALAALLGSSYTILGRFPFSTKLLGGTMGETRAPSLWETLSDPNFMQIRLYNAAYGWWYVMFLDSPLIFITAIAGLLLNIKRWRTFSALYLFPFYGVLAYSMIVREQPHVRFLIEYIPVIVILSAAFIVSLSEFLLPRKTIKPPPKRSIKLKQILTAFVFVEIIFMSFFPHYLSINTAMQNVAWRFNDGEIYDWIQTHTSPKSVIMTPSPLYAYYTGREIVTIPRPRGTADVDIGMISFLIKRYNVDYIIINRDARSIADLRAIRENPVNAPHEFNLVYWDEDQANFDPRILIYDVRALHS